MNRRGFISLLAGAAGAPLVPWRGLIDPVILLPPRQGKLLRYDGFELLLADCDRYELPRDVPIGTVIMLANIGRSPINIFPPGGAAVRLKPGGATTSLVVAENGWYTYGRGIIPIDT